jgi:hypothetical protein
MGSLALVPIGYLVAGPLANAFGAREVLGIGGGLAIFMLALALLPRSTRELGGPSAAGDLAVPQPSSSRAISA